MSAVCLLKRGVLALAVAGVLATGLGAAVAAGEVLAPWWGVGSGARPTNLQWGVAVDEVLDLTPSATSGRFYVENSTTGKKLVHPHECVLLGPEQCEAGGLAYN